MIVYCNEIDSHTMATVDPIILATDWQGNDVYEGDEGLT